MTLRKSARIELTHWRSLATFSGKVATREDVNAGRAVFCTAGPDRQPYNMALPACAIQRDRESGEKTPAIVIQAECFKDDVVVGVRYIDGRTGVCTLSELELLDGPNDLFPPSKPRPDQPLFKSLLGPLLGSPERILTSAELEALRDLIRGCLVRHAIKHSFLENQNQLHLHGDDSKIDMQQLALTCSRSPKDQWKRIVWTTLQRIPSIRAAMKENDSPRIPFSKAQDRLAIRLLPGKSLKASGHEGLVCREDLEGTISALALDLPAVAPLVTSQMAVSWGKSDEELFQIAVQNMLEFDRQYPEGIKMVLPGDVATIAFSEDSYFVATRILFMASHDECVGEYGSLIGIPVHDTMICRPIDDKQIAQAIHIMLASTKDVYHSVPGGVSPYLYWYCQDHQEHFSPIRYRERDGVAVLPQELAVFVGVASE